MFYFLSGLLECQVNDLNESDSTFVFHVFIVRKYQEYRFAISALSSYTFVKISSLCGCESKYLMFLYV